MRQNFNELSFTPYLPLPNILVWDMDGTLTQSKMSRFVGSEQETNARRLLVAADRCYKTARSMKNLIAPNLHINDTTKSRLLQVISRRQEDMIESLSFVKNFDMRQAIVSNNSRSAMGNKVLNHLEMSDYIEHSLFQEDMKGFKKPNVEVMGILADQMNFKDSDTIWVIGDSASDMKFALSADQVMPQQIIPVAMGVNSRAAMFLNSEENIKHHAIMSEPLDVTLLCSINHNALDWDIKMHGYNFEEADQDTHIHLDPEN